MILALAYFLGPRPEPFNFVAQPVDIEQNLLQLDTEIDKEEAAVLHIKKDNEAEIIWYNDSLKNKIEYAIVNLHGFSGSRFGAEPMHKDVAKKFGCNLYLARLQAHGLDEEESLLNFDAEAYVQSALEAIEIGKTIGKKVIVMGTSTGSTASLTLAANDPDIAALIHYSPNIDLYDPRAGLLTGPWGLQIARMVNGGDYYEWSAEPWCYKYWNMKYRIEGLIELKNMIDVTMTEETFNKVTQPTFIGYWYKNDEECDKTISVDRIKDMYAQLGTAEDQKVMHAYPDAGTHVIACGPRSGAYEQLRDDTFDFMENVLGVEAVE